MEILNSVLKLSAGIGLFLFAMYLLEESLKNLAGRNFKIFLQRSTKNRIGAVSGGALVTGILQSSSMVSFMVLAFVGAGVFTMKNALAIILGANLGTTLDSWLVATLGFKFNIEAIAYPAVFIGGLMLITFGKSKKVKYASYFLFGFGLLFIGLSYMKEAMVAHQSSFNFSKYSETSLFVFLIIGFTITFIVQSSSVTMALTLTALNVGALNFPAAAAIVLGSETGTTIKIVLSAIGGNASKKRVVLGNLLFNIFLTVFAFILLKPILHLITENFKINDPLIGLVTFSSLINLAGIIIFLPFLDLFAKFLEMFFKSTDASIAAFIGHASTSEPETALDLFRRETAYFINNSMLFNISLFEIDPRLFNEQPEYKIINDKKHFYSKTIEEKYMFLKQLQGELQAFYIELRAKLNDARISELGQLISSVRSAMHSVKNLKDVERNINDLSRSSKDIKFNFFIAQQQKTVNLHTELNTLMTENKDVRIEKLKKILEDIITNYSSALDNFYKEAPDASIEGLDMTTIINFNRELFTSNKAMIMAAKDFLLNEKEAEDFNQLALYRS